MPELNESITMDTSIISPSGEEASGRVIVGMSGGVDSSVAALILKRAGYDVIGVFMKNWDEDEDEDEGGVCTAAEDYEYVRRTADKIGIPYYTVNFTKEYYDRVFSHFLFEYERGRTPNPDVLCNSEIKFDAFLSFAMKQGAHRLATGHYARLERRDSVAFLMRGADSAKDQSYFLAGLTQEQIKRAMFPIGELKKTDVRKIAGENGLINADRKDSTGICFIGERNFKRFLMQYLPAKPGDIVDIHGKTLGRHDGLMYYTLGQRRGLGIGGMRSGNGESFFVVDKDMENNRLIVRQGDGPELYSDGLYASRMNFIAHEPEKREFDCTAKFRYRQPDQTVHVSLNDFGECRIDFDTPQRAVTPGQWAVLYSGDICLGGGVIESTFKNRRQL